MNILVILCLVSIVKGLLYTGYGAYQFDQEKKPKDIEENIWADAKRFALTYVITSAVLSALVDLLGVYVFTHLNLCLTVTYAVLKVFKIAETLFWIIQFPLDKWFWVILIKNLGFIIAAIIFIKESLKLRKILAEPELTVPEPTFPHLPQVEANTYL